MTKEKLKQAVKHLPQKKNYPRGLFANVVDFLRNEGESKFLAKWVMESLLATGQMAPPHSGTPTVSCLIPCYNHGQYLRETVLSVLHQDYPAFEIIIINDGSTDNSHEVSTGLVEEFSQYRIRYLQQENSGPVEARNRGCALAKGKYILPLDADDIIAPSFLSKTVKILDEFSHLGYVSTLALFFGHSNLVWPKFKFKPIHFFSVNQQTCTTLFRKSMWEDVGGYEKDMANGYEDWELWIRATKHGWLGTQIEEPLFFYRRKEVSRNTGAKERDVSIKTHIILLHPDIYDKSKLKLVMKEMAFSNWIPPQLVRPDFKVTLRNSNPTDQSALAKRILGYLAHLVPQAKGRFLAPEAGTGETDKFEKLYKQISSRILKVGQADPLSTLDLGALLLSLYPHQKPAITLFINTLLQEGALNEVFSISCFYLDLFQWDEDILNILTEVLMQKADNSQENKIIVYYQTALIFSPHSKLVLLKTYEYQIANRFYRNASITQKLAKRYNITLPEMPLKLAQESKDKKNVWYVSSSIGYAGGINGVSQAQFKTLDSLLQNNDLCNLTIITPLSTSLASNLLEFENQRNNKSTWPNIITTIRKDVPNSITLKKQNIFNGLWNPSNLPEGKPDFIILEGVRKTAYDYFVELGIDYSCPVSYIYHSSPEQYYDKYSSGKIKLSTMVQAMSGLEYHITVAKCVVDAWREIPDLKDKKWFNIPNCIREPEINAMYLNTKENVRAELNLSKDDFIITCVASVQLRKGQDILLNQLENFLKDVPNAQVLFVGPILKDRGGTEILDLAKKINHTDKVHFLNVKLNALDYIYCSDLFVLPSREEALPLSILEAMALETPCVASDVYGIPELIKHGETGLMFSHDRPQDLATHIVDLSKDSQKRALLAKNGKARYWDHFSQEKHVANWRKVLLEVFS